MSLVTLNPVVFENRECAILRSRPHPYLWSPNGLSAVQISAYLDKGENYIRDMLKSEEECRQDYLCKVLSCFDYSFLQVGCEVLEEHNPANLLYIINLTDNPDFLDQMKKLARLFDQAHLLFIPKGAQEMQLIGIKNSHHIRAGVVRKREFKDFHNSIRYFFDCEGSQRFLDFKHIDIHNDHRAGSMFGAMAKHAIRKRRENQLQKTDVSTNELMQLMLNEGFTATESAYVRYEGVDSNSVESSTSFLIQDLLEYGVKGIVQGRVFSRRHTVDQNESKQANDLYTYSVEANILQGKVNITLE